MSEDIKVFYLAVWVVTILCFTAIKGCEVTEYYYCVKNVDVIDKEFCKR